MKLSHIILFSVMAVACIGYATAANQVMVTNVTIDPPVLMKGDTGIVKIQVVNNGDTGLVINRALLLGGDFTVTSDPYPTVGWLGARNTMDFTFTVQAGNQDGIFYPRFVLEYTDGSTLRYAVPIQVDSTDLTLALVEKPDYLAVGKTTEYTLIVGNPRTNSVSSVQVFPEGPGYEATPTSQFIGFLPSDNEARVAFNITLGRISTAHFRVTYRNGINEHETVLTIPLLPTDNKKAADPLITNIQVSQDGELYHISGDISNAGLKSAKSVVIRTESPAIAEDPYKIYVVGSLEPDDFSGFEVTFRLSTSGTVPLIVEFKDEEGNRYISQSDVTVSVPPLSDTSSALPKMGALLVWLLVFAIAAVIFYSWRKR
ncbi:MAG: hypothetical protein LUQ17_02645 [Methanomicrobiales archaeon]|nr:hypothetical protein [Methanomicrobiales archaeon]